MVILQTVRSMFIFLHDFNGKAAARNNLNKCFTYYVAICVYLYGHWVGNTLIPGIIRRTRFNRYRFACLILAIYHFG